MQNSGTDTPIGEREPPGRPSPTIAVAALEIPTATGAILRGQRWGDGPNAAILVHAPGDDLDAWGDFPADLAGQGFAVVAFDLPGHGLSDDPWQPDLLGEAIRAVARHARAGGARRVFLVAAGASIPGALGAGAGGGAEALVALSPPDLDDPRAIPGVRDPSLPKLLLVGAAEEAAMAAARKLVRRCTGWTVLSTSPTPDQGPALLMGAPGRLARQRIIGFLRDYRVGGR